ncbi:SusC/RagA family TonB-linked outer membrane protein, partial [Sinomicrobium weinanense]
MMCCLFTVLITFVGRASVFYSQSTITISGTVTDEKGVPMPGVNVIELNSSRGTTTDFDGNFSLKVKEGATVEFSYIGYNKYILENTSEAMKNLEVKLEPDSSELDEVVVIGYSTQSKKDLTGAVATVSSEDITQRNVTNISQAIQGAMPGVTVTNNGSAPGSGASIRVRGITTLQGSTSPLILVDDVPVGSLDDVNPNDVESISVLKDAAAAAIYGSRAAAGVVIVTTKRGREGVFNINYSGTQIVNTPTEIRSTVGPLRYMEMSNEMSWNDVGNGDNEFPIYSQDFIDSYLENNIENPDEYPLTDYKDLILKDYAFGYRHNLTISGGGEKVKTLASLGYEKQEALYDHREWKRYTARVNTDIKLSDKFGANLDISARLGNAEGPIVDPTNLAIESPSIFPAVWSDGRISGGKQGENIYAELHHGGFTNTDTYQFFGKFGVYYKPVKDLKISLNLSPRYNFTRYKSFNKTIPYWDYDDPLMTGEPNYIKGHNVLDTRLTERRKFYKALTTQVLVNYDKSFGKHHIEALLGFEEFSSEDEVLGVAGREYDVVEYPFLNQAPVDKVFNDNTSISELAYSSHFGRVAYNYDSKYYAQVNVRRDASSRFGSAYRWGTFPSVSLGWVPSNEDFFSGLNSLVSFLKFRGSYGKLGNDRLGNYLYLSVLQFSNTLFANGSEVESLRTAAQHFLAINDITWESTT